MPAPAENPENVKILHEIYDNSKSDQEFAKKDTFKQSLKAYFSKPGMVDRWISGGVLFFGLTAIVLGFFQFKYNLTNQFKRLPAVIGLDNSQLENSDEVDLLGLRQKDTDLDGLSDYDELNVYQSSPYLKDTDSDGKSDPDEVAAQTDPNCKTGENCFGSFVNANPVTDVNPSDLQLNQQIQGPQIRQLLLEAGMTQEELSALTDEDLFAAYETILLEEQNELASPSISVSGNIEDLTPDEIRELLAGQGIDQAILDNVSDAELIDLVNETLNSQ